MKIGKKGFTLPELLVVITIIGFLVIGAISVYQYQLMKAKDGFRKEVAFAIQDKLNFIYNRDGGFGDFDKKYISSQLFGDNQFNKLESSVTKEMDGIFIGKFKDKENPDFYVIKIGFSVNQKNKSLEKFGLKYGDINFATYSFYEKDEYEKTENAFLYKNDEFVYENNSNMFTLSNEEILQIAKIDKCGPVKIKGSDYMFFKGKCE